MMFIPEIYGPVFSRLLQEERLMPLGPGEKIKEGFEELRKTRIASAFEGQRVMNRDAAECCLAGLWLYFNYLDTSHAISPEIFTQDGSYWHGMMHRREGDYWNAGYWFRKVSSHPIFLDLHDEAAEIVTEIGINAATSFLVHQEKWDPLLFIELIEKSVNTNKPTELICKKIQLAEWQLLFDHCYHEAIID